MESVSPVTAIRLASRVPYTVVNYLVDFVMHFAAITRLVVLA